MFNFFRKKISNQQISCVAAQILKDLSELENWNREKPDFKKCHSHSGNIYFHKDGNYELYYVHYWHFHVCGIIDDFFSKKEKQLILDSLKKSIFILNLKKK